MWVAPSICQTGNAFGPASHGVYQSRAGRVLPSLCRRYIRAALRGCLSTRVSSNPALTLIICSLIGVLVCWSLSCTLQARQIDEDVGTSAHFSAPLYDTAHRLVKNERSGSGEGYLQVVGTDGDVPNET